MIHAVRGAGIWRGCYNCANVGNLVLLAFLGRGKRNLAVVGLALLLSCCTNERETKILLGIPDTVEQTPATDAEHGYYGGAYYGGVGGAHYGGAVAPGVVVAVPGVAVAPRVVGPSCRRCNAYRCWYVC